MTLPPVELMSLDARLEAVDAGVSVQGADDLLAHRAVIGELREGVRLRRWSEDAFPWSAHLLNALPRSLTAADAAVAVARAQSSNCARSIMLSGVRSALVSALRRKAGVHKGPHRKTGRDDARAIHVLC